MSTPVPGVPLVVRPAGQRVVVVGGGQVAAAKAEPMAAAGAEIVVVAPAVVAPLEAIAARVERRPYAGAQDLAGAVIVLAATDRPDVNTQVAADAAAAATLCVRSDPRPHDDAPGTADLAAGVTRGPVTIAVTTAGTSPALARWLREDLEQHYGDELAVLATMLDELRRDPAVLEALAPLDGDARRAAWRSLPVADILALLRAGSVHSAREVAFACLSSSSG